MNTRIYVAVYILLFFGGLGCALAGIVKLYNKRRTFGSAMICCGLLSAISASGLLLFWSWQGGL